MKKIFEAAGAVMAVIVILGAIGYVADKPTSLADSVGSGLHTSVDFLKSALSSAGDKPKPASQLKP